MMYKCLKCEEEFDARVPFGKHAICPMCKATGKDVVPRSKYLRAQAVA